MGAADRADFWSDNGSGKHAAHPAKEKKGGGFIKNFLIDLVIAICLASVILHFIRPTIVKQNSMEDTLHENDYMIMFRQAYKNKDPERGDIVIFQSKLSDENTGKKKLLIKRVIGLPGDAITISGGQLYINGEVYEENYIKDGYTPAMEIPSEGETFTVPENSYYCLGDNRVNSLDSRISDIGCVDRSSIKGKVVLRLFPFNKIRRF